MVRSSQTVQTVQPYAKADGKLYFITIPGVKPVLTIDGKNYSPKLDKPLTVKGKTLCVLSQERARASFVIDGQMYYAQHGGILYKGDGEQIVEEVWQTSTDASIYINKVKEADGLREVKMGSQKVAEQPSDADFGKAAVWSLELKAEAGPSIKNDQLMTMDLQPSPLDMPDDYFLRIDYQGDAARVYADGQLVEDNFWNGKPMFVRLSDLVGKRVELRILPLGKQYPIYLQKEQREVLDAAPGNALLELKGVTVLHRETVE